MSTNATVNVFTHLEKFKQSFTFNKQFSASTSQLNRLAGW